jgi:ferredoxin
MDSMTIHRLPLNVDGKYFVGDECDGCAYCALVAPDNFDFDKPSNTYYICRQPQSSGELELVLEALEDCPVGAIHIDEEAAKD